MPEIKVTPEEIVANRIVAGLLGPEERERYLYRQWCLYYQNRTGIFAQIDATKKENVNMLLTAMACRVGVVGV